ncbi:S46 family peptidase [uncultured Alistipes sp.]|uniref:S46 family peptidase n=1 Tax=uncultured Alistipes sp. TaxID=538949 RepID=UPI0025CB9923|nr:S46 family peptidase [uncultured Alistipes sp.]
MKRILFSLFAIILVLPALADEGMWLPSLISDRIEDMRAKGFRLTSEDIYSINKASMKDAVVLFDGGCTGELISKEGLLLTNHHCGYDAIADHSSVQNDYLTNGFWAMSRAEELPNKKLNVKFLVRMEEVTDRIAAGESKEEIIRNASAEGTGYKAAVEQMYYGNQQFLFVYEQFDDVRLVAAPPSSIGKFGGDTDNWIWPRHTGDFSLFRIYAGKDNKPAAYSPDNVPYRSKRHFRISTAGVQEGDFTMIYGFPGNTQEYILSDAVAYIAERTDPAKIAIRTGRLDIISAAQTSDPALRIHYAAKHVSIANAWKKWQGEALGINRLGTVASKRTYEQAFAAWAQDKPEYRNVVADLKAEYDRVTDAYFAREITRETLDALPKRYTAEERTEGLFAKRKPTERALYEWLFGEYARRCPVQYQVPEFLAGVAACGSPEAYAGQIFEKVWEGTDSIAIKKLAADTKRMQDHIEWSLGTKALRNLNSGRLNELYTTYIKGLREWDTTRAFYPDANLTLRVAYGHVAGYEYADGEYHKPQTTLDGIIAKDNPDIYDYDIPQALRDLYASKDYGRWGVMIDGRKTVPVCFLATNHTTGGNSGSPILNARGELVGLNFDRTWRSTMSDIVFDESICRNISVDIRYVLFVVDRIGGAGYLFKEMEISNRK